MSFQGSYPCHFYLHLNTNVITYDIKYLYNGSQQDALFLNLILIKKLNMFQTDLLSIIRSLDTVFTAIGICRTVYVDSLLVRLGWNSVCSIFIGRYLPTKMKETECSKMSAYKIQTPGNYPEESIQHSEHGKSLKSRKCSCLLVHVHDASCLSNILPVTINKTSYLELGCLHFFCDIVWCWLVVSY